VLPRCALVTDGRFSGASHGICCGHVTPEAQDGGPLAVVQDGDTVEIDIDNKTIDLQVPQEELESRLREWNPPADKYPAGTMLAKYKLLVSSASEGATLAK
jgi:dihydroxy-acid dehydratase